MMFFVLPLAHANAIHVTFLNPGHLDQSNKTGGFWSMVSLFMQQAADDLDIELEILYASRNHRIMVEQAQTVLQRETLPDYLVIVNEKKAAEAILNQAKGKSTQVLLILNDLLQDQKERIGEPRGRINNWIGTLIPDNQNAGYILAKKLIDTAIAQQLMKDDGSIRMAGISGDNGTFASIERVKGLKKAAMEYDNVVIEQISDAHWSIDNAERVGMGLFKRYPMLDIIWSANDTMAYGAMNAQQKTDYRPGEPLLFGGLNLEEKALNLIKNNQMVASVGGHYMTGAWALIMLYDYHHGIDFNQQEELGKHIFGLVTQENVDQYHNILGNKEKWADIDFNKFTKKASGKDDYQFSLDLFFE